jgi:hypothetical protein
MDIETINGADTTSRKDGCELLYLARRRADKHGVRIDTIEAVIMMENTCQLHVRSGFDGFFGCTADVAVS